MTAKKSNSDLITFRLDSIDEKLTRLDEKVDHTFVSKDTYQVEVKALKDDVRYLKNLVYGTVGTFLTLAISALVAGRVIK